MKCARHMKGLVGVILIALIASAYSPPANAAVDVSFDFFYSDLSPHGGWQVSSEYGRVWQPAVYGPGWNPYYDGHWVYTDLGWTWVSDYEWGDVCYHYGTWVEDPVLGWAWVPGYVWAPSWVVFRTGPDYIGWAPVRPGYSVGASFDTRGAAAGPFVFVSAGNFLAPRVRTYVVPQSRTTVIVNRTRIVNNLRIENNVVVNRGPDVSLVERASGRRIQQERIESVPRVAPGGRFSRDRIVVDPRQMRQGVRAAEPARQNLTEPVRPDRPDHGARIDGRGNNQPRQPAVSRPAQHDQPQPGKPQPKREQRKPHGKPASPPPDNSSMKSHETVSGAQRGHGNDQRTAVQRTTVRREPPRNSPVIGSSSRTNASGRGQAPPPVVKRQKPARGAPPAPSHRQQGQSSR